MKQLNNMKKVRDAYSNQNLPKYITIEFTDFDIEPITNEDLTEDSIKLIESICEESVLEFGGCNASELSFTVFGRKEEFRGKKIKCTISVKNPQYRGNFHAATDYKRRDIVKYNDEYYQFFNDYQSSEESCIKVDSEGLLVCDGIGAPVVNSEGILSFPDVEMNTDSDGVLGYVSSTSITPDKLTDYCDKLYAYYDTSDIEDIVLFQGKIDSAKKQTDRNFKDIIAYDWLYDVGQKDITEWFNASTTGIIEPNYVGEWSQEKQEGLVFKKGNIVLFEFYQVEKYSYYFRMIKEFKSTDSAALSRTPNINPDYWEQLYDLDSMNLTNIASMRKKLFDYLGYSQEFINGKKLELDNLELLAFKQEEKITVQSLLENICKVNCCFGKVNPANEAFQYLFINSENEAEDVSEIYDPEKCTYQDNKGGVSRNIAIVDSNGNILAGYKYEPVLQYNVDNFLLKMYFGNRQNTDYENFFHWLNGAGGTVNIPNILKTSSYVPVSLEFEGLPYMDVGDNIQFNTKDVDEDITINTIVLSRTLSGINALTDNVESKNE